MPLEDPQGHDLTGKVVVLSREYYKGDQEARRFHCQGGFGCKSHTHGNGVFGQFMSDGERCRVERYEIEFVEVSVLDGLFEQAEGKGS